MEFLNGVPQWNRNRQVFFLAFGGFEKGKTRLNKPSAIDQRTQKQQEREEQQ